MIDNQIEQLLNNRIKGTWSVNDRGLVDVDGSVYLSSLELTKLPVNFGKVTGNFWCQHNQLTTLKGTPEQVGGHFYCYKNQLTTLKDAPQKIGSGFYCDKHLRSDLEYKKYLIRKKLSDG